MVGVNVLDYLNRYILPAYWARSRRLFISPTARSAIGGTAGSRRAHGQRIRSWGQSGGAIPGVRARMSWCWASLVGSLVRPGIVPPAAPPGPRHADSGGRALRVVRLLDV